MNKGSSLRVPIRPKNYYSEFFLIELKFKKYQKKIIDKNLSDVFSSHICLALSSLLYEIYKYSIERNNKIFFQSTLSLIRQIFIFFFISLPVRFLSKKKINIIHLSNMHPETIFKIDEKKKKLNFIVEKNTGFILNFFLIYLIKKSKLLKEIKQSFLISKQNGLKLFLKNQDQLLTEINRLIKLVLLFLKITKTKNIINNDSESVQGSIIALSGNSNNSKIFEFYHGFYNKNSLLGVYPAMADFQIHWTKDVIDSFLTCLPTKSRNKYKCFGYPIKFKSNIKLSDSILILFPPISDIPRRESFKIVNDFLKIIHHFSLFSSVRVRFHPSINKNEFNYYSKLIIKNRGAISFYKDALIDLKLSKMVLGFSSTLLVTALYNNIPALKIARSSYTYCDKVKEISFKKIFDMFRTKKDITKFIKNFQFPKIKTFNYEKFNKIIN